MLRMSDSLSSEPAIVESTLTLPPPSFRDLIKQAADATTAALADGQQFMEVEFPPVPLSKLEDSSLSTYDLLSANLQLVLEFCKKLELRKDAIAVGKAIAITLPDAAERVRAAEYLGDEEPAPGVRFWAISGGDAKPSPFGVFTSLLKGAASVEVAPWASMYIILSVSCAELPSIRQLAEMQPAVPIVCFNLKLDTLRGDIGLPGFPGKQLQHDFLTRFKPVYYMRPRSYSLSLSRPPFLLSYAGVLFRCYPEGYQTLLDRGRSNYRQVLVQERRPALGQFKAQLSQALKLSDEDAAASISQTGYKQSTWWEDDEEGRDMFDDWRS
eukprot:CAMPEP_0119305090 /NCGR_PEP_ID=MMETSP1333-20130426/6169_1 /TAXON_ID=418940 /ORGANISM="Scyphosphaera apsteinii, Strain RCC1455" /LENGTH=325 /DNA_ID=CAMNT_0007308099 /DNA_START=125 /DNA_END=1102 /DNA_ORIENTATION=-